MKGSRSFLGNLWFLELVIQRIAVNAYNAEIFHNWANSVLCSNVTETWLTLGTHQWTSQCSAIPGRPLWWLLVRWGLCTVRAPRPLEYLLRGHESLTLPDRSFPAKNFRGEQWTSVRFRLEFGNGKSDGAIMPVSRRVIQIDKSFYTNPELHKELFQAGSVFALELIRKNVSR